jgi:hypothetical protein
MHSAMNVSDLTATTSQSASPRPRGDSWRLADVSQPQARRHENRGRAWLVFGFIFCPCHLPLTMALLGALVGGGALGAAARDAWAVGVAMTAVYAFTVWRGFVHLRRAKSALAPGESLACSINGCEPS